MKDISQAGCDPVSGRIPPAKLGFYRHAQYADIRRDFQAIRANAVNVTSGVDYEVCFGTSKRSRVMLSVLVRDKLYAELAGEV